MLNNKDFAQLSSTPSSNGKVRFDLNQIKKWDKEIESELKKKNTKAVKHHENESEEEKLDKKQENQKPLYRDRASERRSQDLKEDPLEKLAANLDIEQSKFLGGDIEYTHLVKGLDIALLQRNRAELISSSEGRENTDETASSKKLVVKSLSDIICQTQLGQSIQKVLVSSIIKHPFQLETMKTSTFSGKGYEFNLDLNNFDDIPTEILRSKQEIDSEEVINSRLSLELRAQLAITLQAYQRQKLKRKQMDTINHYSSTSAISTSSSKISSLGILKEDKTSKKFISNDIFENIGKYEPVGSLSETEINNLKSITNTEIDKSLEIENIDERIRTQSDMNNNPEVLRSIFADIDKHNAVLKSATSLSSSLNESKGNNSTLVQISSSENFNENISKTELINNIPIRNDKLNERMNPKIIHRDIFSLNYSSEKIDSQKSKEERRGGSDVKHKSDQDKKMKEKSKKQTAMRGKNGEPPSGLNRAARRALARQQSDV